MSLVSQAVGFVFVSLIVINGLLSGAVVDAFTDFSTAEEKEQARIDLMCGSGYLLFMPTENWYGIEVPIPSYTNVIIAALISLSLVMLIRIATGIDWRFKYSIGLFIFVWFAIKIIGFMLMKTAGADCEVWAQDMVSQTEGIYSVAALGGSLWGLKIIWGLRK